MVLRKNKKVSRSSSGYQLLAFFAVVAAGLCVAAVFAVSHLPVAPKQDNQDHAIRQRVSVEKQEPPAAVKKAIAQEAAKQTIEKGKKEVTAPPAEKAATKKFADTDVEAITAEYEALAQKVCNDATKNGVLDRILIVSKITGVFPEHMMTLATFESGGGEEEQTDTVENPEDRTSAVGILQITNGTFLEMLGRYGKEAVAFISQLNEKKAKEFKYILGFHSFDWKTSKVSLNYDAFNEAHGAKDKALRKRILDFRKDKEIGNKLSLFLSFRDVEKKLPYLERSIDEKAPTHVKELIKKYGRGFTYRLLHQWGLDGAIKIVTTQDPNALMDGVLGNETAKRNGCAGQTVWRKMHEDAVKYRAVAMTVHRYLKNDKKYKPKTPAPVKQAAAQKVAKNG